MTVTQRLMKPGRFHVELRDDYPDSIAAACALFDHIVITPTPIDPSLVSTTRRESSGVGDSVFLAASIYTGVITSKPSRRILEGCDLSFWLGTDQGLGALMGANYTISTGELGGWVGLILAGAVLTAGTITNGSYGSIEYPYNWVTRRELLDQICRIAGAEWRVNPNGTVDAAEPATLWTSPTQNSGIVITRHAEGMDGSLRGLEGSLMVPASDVEGYTTKVYAVGPNISGSAEPFDYANASLSTPFVDLNNNPVVMERAIDVGQGVSHAELQGLANATLNLNGSVRREISLGSNTYNVTRFIRPGDSAFVWDHAAELSDPANTIMYRGELINPMLLRVRALTWPVEKGLGVYLRKSGSPPSYLDLSPYLNWESEDVQWEVGAESRMVEQVTGRR
jgi:hypothetical protein